MFDEQKPAAIPPGKALVSVSALTDLLQAVLGSNRGVIEMKLGSTRAPGSKNPIDVVLAELEERLTELEIEVVAARPLSDYSEDMGPVCWWLFPIAEAAWIGTPNDDEWPGYHTHFTPHPPVPADPA